MDMDLDVDLNVDMAMDKFAKELVKMAWMCTWTLISNQTFAKDDLDVDLDVIHEVPRRRNRGEA